MEDQAIINKISKGASLLLVGIVISKLLTYLYRLIIARYLGPGIYGLFSIGLAVIGVVLSISLVGLPQGILRYVSYYFGKNDSESIHVVFNNAIKIVLPISIFFSAILFIFADWISITLFHSPQLIRVLQIFACAVPISVVAACMEYTLQAFQKIKYIVISRNIIEPVVKLLFSVLVIYLGYSLVGITAVYLISLIIVTFFFAYFLKKVLSFKKILSAPSSMYKPLLFFSLPLMLSDLFISLLLWSDTLILGSFVIAAQVGIYNAVVPTARLIHTIPVALRALFIPTISGLYAQKKGIAPVYNTITKWLFLTGISSVTFVCVYSRQLLSIFFGKVFAEGYIPLILVALSFFAYSLVFPLENILMVMKKTKLILFNTALAVVFNITLNLLLIPKFGIYGAALSTAFAFMIITLLVAAEAYYFVKLFPLKLNYLRAVMAAFVSLAAVICIGSYIDSYRILGLLTLGIIYLILYFLLLLFTRAIGKTEFAMIKAAWQKLKRMF